MPFPGWPTPKIARWHKSHGKGNENVDLMMLRKYVVRMLKAEVPSADHQRLTDNVEKGSSVALLVQIMEVTTWS